MKTVGVIGGSGLYEIEGLTDVESVSVDTPWGSPSDDLVVGTLGDTKMVFLPRHGRGHKQMPSEINYRANIFAMKKMGVEWIVSVSAVGSMKEHISPGQIVIPSQFYDHTKTRVSTFFGDGIVAHVSMADPVCSILSEELYNASINSGATVHKGGTYLCMEGPQFSSRAESNIYRGWGVDVIGMTNATEAKLAREAEICYASLSMATDYDCWHEHHDDVTVEDLIATLNQNVQLARDIIKKVVPAIGESRECPCCNALQNAIITPKEAITKEIKERLEILIKRYI
ncbi:MAG: S-methyl-5'-thioadenosine phosphorylase [Candidatus Dadabacteria bacterium]|nr:MAG: S-methyl-5'-thioadenosine phosphorylase [Candidatus Dadabacteria bacterium]TDI99713.1 MAG: S-methyl-5'-thioadenosine phosphorylase [Candidatus Dadabacteria bacterium]